MADKAVGDLTPAGTLTGSEALHVVQSGNSRRTTTQAVADLAGGGFTYIGSATIGTAVTGISSATEVLIIANSFTPSTTTDAEVQIGDSGGIETSGYTESADTDSFSTVTSLGASAYSGAVLLVHKGSNEWIATGQCGSFANVRMLAGKKTLSATLDRVLFKMESGSSSDDYHVWAR